MSVNRAFLPWTRKVKWQMAAAKAAGNWPRYRKLYRKLHRGPAIARAARTPGKKRSLPSTCRRGHPFDDVNTRVRGDGRRECRECQRIRRGVKGVK
jgi:hypothetical protein